MYLLNTVLGLLYIGVAIWLLARLAIRNAKRPVQKWAEKGYEPKRNPPVRHIGAAFRATLLTHQKDWYVNP